jgi:hypothetical protein
MLDLKNSATQQAAMEAFFFGYQAFTAKADEMLERCISASYFLSLGIRA